MFSTPASFVRSGADLPDNPSGRWLATLALGLAALIVLVFAPAQAAVPALGQPARAVAAITAGTTNPAKSPLPHRLDRNGTDMTAADIEAPADPALPGAPAEAAPARAFAATPFPETTSPMPAPTPAGSPLRPPRGI